MTGQLTIPFRAEARDIYVVYFSQAAHRTPKPDDLANAARRWQEGHLGEPLKTLVAAFVDRRLVSIRVQPVDSLPALPIELLRHMGLGELEERVVRSAKDAVVVMSQDLNLPPRAGLWGSLSAALGIAEMLDGVVFDPDALRVIDRADAAGWFTNVGRVSAPEHIIVPFSIQDSGLGWMTTRGLQKFGLPDLELRDIPPHLQRLGILMNVVAQYLIDHGFRATKAGEGHIDFLTVDRDVTIDPAVINAVKPSDDVASEAVIRVGLEFDSSAGDFPFVNIVRPAGALEDQGEWLYSVMKRLIPVDDVPFMAKTRGDAMTAAHDRAMAELPTIRARFHGGLSPGEILFVKHGFRTVDDDLEYMWLAVNTWADGRITGQLANIPNNVPSLSLGQTVAIPEVDVFDWMLKLPSGESEGGYTNVVAMREGHQQ